MLCGILDGRGVWGEWIQVHYFAKKGPSSQGYGFSSGHIWMWELDCEESWVLKNWCFWTVVLEKTLESPMDCKEIQPVLSKGDQSWVFFERNDAKAETPVLWPPHAKSWLIGKDSDAGRGWGQEEKGMTEDKMAGWHHRLDGCEFEWTPGVGDGQGGLTCCNSWGHRVGHEWVTELNWTDMYGWFPLLFTWDYHKIVDQLYSNVKQKAFFLMSAFFLTWHWGHRVKFSNCHMFISAKYHKEGSPIMTLWS